MDFFIGSATKYNVAQCLNAPFSSYFYDVCIPFQNFNFNFSGKKEEREYENGVLNGSGVTYGIDGEKFEFTYVDGRIEGEIIDLYRNYRYLW